MADLYREETYITKAFSPHCSPPSTLLQKPVEIYEQIALATSHDQTFHPGVHFLLPTNAVTYTVKASRANTASFIPKNAHILTISRASFNLTFAIFTMVLSCVSLKHKKTGRLETNKEIVCTCTWLSLLCGTLNRKDR